MFKKFLRITEPKRARICGVAFPVVTKLKGVRFADKQGSLAQSREGDKLQFVHTPDEQRPNLVYAYSIPLHALLGRLEERLAEKLIYVFGKGFCVDGEIVKVTGKEIFGCNVAVYDSRQFIGEEE